ncbi:chromosome stability protein 9 [Monosporozyma servazzii]
MSESVFSQNFVFCSVCHQRSSTVSPLMLTSCAHTLCNKHLSQTNVCPICNNKNISTIKLLDERTLPTDVKLFFEPLPNVLESIYNVSLFQINGLNEQVQYYQSHCIKLREKVARQQQLLYQAKNELDTIPVLKQKVQFLEETLKSFNSSRSVRSNRNKSLTTSSRETPFFQRKLNTSFTSSNKEPPPTVDLTLDSDEYNEQQQFISKLKQTTTLRKPQRNQSVQPTHVTSLNHYDYNENNHNNNNKSSKNVRANTVDLNYSMGRREPSARRLSNTKQINNSNDDFIAESTQLNKFNSSTEYQVMSPGQLPSISGIPSPASSNNKTKYYRDNISINNNNNNNDNSSKLETPPGRNNSSIINSLGMPNDDLQRRRMSTIASGRIQFPTPLEKLKIGKRNTITNDKDHLSTRGSPSMLQYMKRRSSTSQIDSPNPKQFANKITKNNSSNNKNNNNKNSQYNRGQTASNFR